MGECVGVPDALGDGVGGSEEREECSKGEGELHDGERMHSR